MNIVILPNKEANTFQASHVYKADLSNQVIKFYKADKMYKKSTIQFSELSFEDGLLVAYKWVLNQLPMGKRIDIQMKMRNATSNEKLEFVVDNIKLNNLYANI